MSFFYIVLYRYDYKTWDIEQGQTFCSSIGIGCEPTSSNVFFPIKDIGPSDLKRIFLRKAVMIGSEREIERRKEKKGVRRRERKRGDRLSDHGIIRDATMKEVVAFSPVETRASRRFFCGKGMRRCRSMWTDEISATMKSPTECV